MANKVFYLSPEFHPYSNTYNLSEFSKKLCTNLHDITDFDVRLNQPKYGYISERKYILREVIRLKEMQIDFNGIEELVNLKSAFIPNTRVQIYFTESDKHFKPLTELIYKSKNGRVNKDNDLKYAYFSKVALETIKRLFWQPDIIICNDWQSSFVPVLLKKSYGNNEYYKDIKTIFILHSINEFRYVSDKSYEYVNLTPSSSKIDNLEQAIKFSDYLIVIDDDQKNMYKLFNKNKNLVKASRKTKTMFLECSPGSSWSGISKKIETLIRKL